MSADKQSDSGEQKEAIGTSVSETDYGDGEFEPTADMLVHDFDDERTLDEEEALEASENQEEEVDNLTKEQDMPIEQLLAIYGAFPPPEATAEEDQVVETEVEAECETNGETEEAFDGNENETDPLQDEGDDQEVSASSASEENGSLHDKVEKSLTLKIEKRHHEKSELSQLYPELEANGDASAAASARSLRCMMQNPSQKGSLAWELLGKMGVTSDKHIKAKCRHINKACSRHQSEDEDEEGEEASGEEEEDWRKTIMIGSSYQAQVPEGLQTYGATPPYENEDKLLWEEHKVTPAEVEEYLKAIGHPPPGAHGIDALPMGSHTRDNEQALHLLLQCGYNVEEALRRYRMNPGKVASCMTLWSEEECRNFENGLKMYGKDFHMIQQNKVRTRSVGELVQFYYLWKKTERHDMFATKTRIEKKKYIVHPGTTDYMDRFLDEGEGLSSGSSAAPTRGDSRSSSPGGVHALLYGNCLRGVQPPIPPASVSSATLTFIGTPLPPVTVASVSPEPSQRQTADVIVCEMPVATDPLALTPTKTPSQENDFLRPRSIESDGYRLAQGLSSRSLSQGAQCSPSLKHQGNQSTSQRGNSSSNCNASIRGLKRPHSPNVDMNVSISHALSHNVRGNSTSVGVESTPAMAKAEAMAS